MVADHARGFRWSAPPGDAIIGEGLHTVTPGGYHQTMTTTKGDTLYIDLTFRVTDPEAFDRFVEEFATNNPSMDLEDLDLPGTLMQVMMRLAIPLSGVECFAGGASTGGPPPRPDSVTYGDPF